MQIDDFSNLKNLSKKLRLQLIQMSHHGKASHLGSALSCLDLVIALYYKFLNIDPKNPKELLRDRFILSKGHAISAQYVVLASLGFFDKELLSTFNKNGSSLPEHPTPNCVAGIEFATGSLGHGLSLALGQALSAKILNQPFKVVALLSDGECNEGSVWEAALLAPKLNLNNLIAIIDYNKWQATARSNETTNLSPLKEKWEAFGWDTYELDGNNIDEILSLFSKIKNDRQTPIAIIANTIKGKGISFMEDDNNWHYKIPNEEEVLKAKQELGV
jgi:transketolase